MRRITSDILKSELEFTTSRASGPGGQHVNKVNSRVTLKFDIRSSSILTEEEKAVLMEKLTTRITGDGVLLLSAQEKRSQLQNKDAVIEKLDQLLAKAMLRKKARKATKPTKASAAKRVQGKKRQGEKKQWRQKPDV